jgi:thiopeptide-type bacteriocin biosynthesis protein
MTQPDSRSPDESADLVERAVLAVLTGTLSHLAASRAGITSAALTEAACAYQRAGRTALAHHVGRTASWNQVIVEFTDWSSAERTAAAVLAPRLQNPEVMSGWWFLRKHPYWRIRYQAATDTTASQASEHVGNILDNLTAAGLIRSWRHGIYEPETLAFGGPAGISIAHQLFCADSVGVLAAFGQDTHAADSGRVVGRRELTVLLCATLMRAAHLDWFEQGDTWDRIITLRPASPDTPAAQHDAIRTLLTADTTPASLLLAPDGPAATATSWLAGFRHAGRALATAASSNLLQRGLRDILAHLIIFHWNRLDLTLTTQAILARTARDAIMSTADDR